MLRTAFNLTFLAYFDYNQFKFSHNEKLSENFSDKFGLKLAFIKRDYYNDPYSDDEK